MSTRNPSPGPLSHARSGTHRLRHAFLGAIAAVVLGGTILVATPASASLVTISLLNDVSPTTGPTSGGTSITVSGLGSVSLLGASVTVGGATCPITATTLLSITCTTPPGSPGPATVAVTTLLDLLTDTNGFTYVTTPSVTAISPSEGPTSGGTSITLSGANLAGATVTVGGGTCAVTNDSDSSVTCTTPSGSAGPATVVVTNAAASLTDADGFTYVSPPTITTVSPTSGSNGGGTVITITGTNLLGATVTVNGATCVIVTDTATMITCIAPSGTPGPTTIVVTTPGGGATNVGGYTYTLAPSISTINPVSGPTSGGTSITLTGTNLAGASVTVGGSPCDVTSSSASSLTCTTPSGSPGPATVVATNVAGSFTDTNGYTYVAPPSVSSVNPPRGSTKGGTLIRIAGRALGGAHVTVGGKACAITSDSSSAIVCRTSAHPAGRVNVVVTTVGGTTTDHNGYTYSTSSAKSVPTRISVVVGDFVNNETTLTPSLKAQVSAFARLIVADKMTKVTLDGYASKPGTLAHNQVLSTDRAQVVEQYLRSQLNALHDSHVAITAVGRGLGHNPGVADNRIVVGVATR